MRIFLATFVWSLVLGQTVSAADADGPRMEEVLTLMQARNLIAGCEAYAEDNKLAPLSMAVYDASGNLKHFSRQDGAILVTVEFAHVKGRTAAVVGMATSELGAIEFANKTGLTKPKVAILSGTEDPIESMPSSVEAKEVMELAKKENVNAYIHGPLALDNAISKEAAKIKNIQNDVAGDADILLVPNLETGNSLSKIMVYLMQACAAGIIVGGKIPVVLPSRADNKISKLASIAASIIAAQ